MPEPLNLLQCSASLSEVIKQFHREQECGKYNTIHFLVMRLQEQAISNMNTFHNPETPKNLHTSCIKSVCTSVRFSLTEGRRKNLAMTKYVVVFSTGQKTLSELLILLLHALVPIFLRKKTSVIGLSDNIVQAFASTVSPGSGSIFLFFQDFYMCRNGASSSTRRASGTTSHYNLLYAV